MLCGTGPRGHIGKEHRVESKTWPLLMLREVRSDEEASVTEQERVRGAAYAIGVSYGCGRCETVLGGWAAHRELLSGGGGLRCGSCGSLNATPVMRVRRAPAAPTAPRSPRGLELIPLPPGWH